MSSIQDIHAFEERIYDIVQDYVDNNYDEGDRSEWRMSG